MQDHTVCACNGGPGSEPRQAGFSLGSQPLSHYLSNTLKCKCARSPPKTGAQKRKDAQEGARGGARLPMCTAQGEFRQAVPPSLSRRPVSSANLHLCSCTNSVASNPQVNGGTPSSLPCGWGPLCSWRSFRASPHRSSQKHKGCLPEAL